VTSEPSAPRDDPALGLSRLSGRSDDPLEALLWGPLRESFGLTAEPWRRLTEVVTLHMALDRMLFLRVTLGLTVVAGARANVARISHRVSTMRFAARLHLAQDAGWISEEVAADAAAVNGLRNRLLHYDLKGGVEPPPEIASPEAFRTFTERAVRAWRGLAADVMPLVKRAAQEGKEA
jgi:hypothetical protein